MKALTDTPLLTVLSPMDGVSIVGDAAKKHAKDHPSKYRSRAKSTNFNERVIELVDVDSFDDVIHALLIAAKDGKQWAVQEVLNRVLGKPHQSTSVSQVNIDMTPSAMKNRIDEIMGIKPIFIEAKTSSPEGEEV